MYPEVVKTVRELQVFEISAEKIVEKYSLKTGSCVFRRNTEIEHVYHELYTNLKHPSLTFLRLKVLELLYHFQSRQTVFEEKQEYLSGTTVERIKHAREHLIQDMEHRINLKDLAWEHNLSLTQLKLSLIHISKQIQNLNICIPINIRKKLFRKVDMRHLQRR